MIFWCTKIVRDVQVPSVKHFEWNVHDGRLTSGFEDRPSTQQTQKALAFCKIFGKFGSTKSQWPL